MKNKTLYAFIAMGLVAIFGISLVVAYPGFGKTMAPDLSDEEIAEREQFREDLRVSIDNEDYSTWRSLMESQLTEENFQRVVDRHNAMEQRHEIMQELRDAIESGDTETVDQLREELSDLGFSKARGSGHHGMKGNLGNQFMSLRN